MTFKVIIVEYYDKKILGEIMGQTSKQNYTAPSLSQLENKIKQKQEQQEKSRREALAWRNMSFLYSKTTCEETQPQLQRRHTTTGNEFQTLERLRKTPAIATATRQSTGNLREFSNRDRRSSSQRRCREFRKRYSVEGIAPTIE